jgi:hypothetical protein
LLLLYLFSTFTACPGRVELSSIELVAAIRDTTTQGCGQMSTRGSQGGQVDGSGGAALCASVICMTVEAILARGIEQVARDVTALQTRIPVASMVPEIRTLTACPLHK